MDDKIKRLLISAYGHIHAVEVQALPNDFDPIMAQHIRVASTELNQAIGLSDQQEDEQLVRRSRMGG